jgi:hypothetical protein
MKPPANGKVSFGLDAVIVAVDAEAPRVLTVPAAGGLSALPSGPLDLVRHHTLERGVREWVQSQARLELGYVEQLYTFGDRFRDPREVDGGVRMISAAYLALVREELLGPDAGARFVSWYEFLPWEDWRSGRPALVEREIRPALQRWAAEHAGRRERVQITFGFDGTQWDPERTLERYELLWEAGLVDEARRGEDRPGVGRPLALDHRRMIAQALGRLRGKVRYRPVVFELLPEEFTLLRLQRVVESIAGSRLHKQNFRRLVEAAGLVERTGRFEHTGRGRPAELFGFRREVLRERPAPGIHFPGARWAG